ncbi:MAG: murein biosynthesis integral membrane protein MurJ [Micavibrio sp.]|nr:murein biosynthesis integral membrane protein MurJ [Micavibrio sp.]
MRLFKALATVSLLTSLSRIGGFIRDIIMAAVLGAGPVADAFFIALKMPNMFRRITAEGALTVAFVPTYTEKQEREGQDSASDYAGTVAGVLSAVLIPFSILIIWLMPYVMGLLAPGFEIGETRYTYGVEFSRITFFYLTLMSLAALMGGVMNAHNRFVPFAAAPVLFNVCLIGGLLISGYFDTVGHALSWAVLFSGVLQFIFLWVCMKAYKIRFNFKKPIFNSDIKKLFKLMGPGVVGAGVAQINLFVDVILASLLPAGAISALYYADRLNQLPLGIVGVAIGTALLPMMARAVSANDTQRASQLFFKSLFFGLLLALPAAVALGCISNTLIGGLFERGEFTADNTALTANVLKAYAIGLPAFILTKVYATFYFSRQDTITPVKISAVTTILNTLMSLAAINYLGIIGIALATSVAMWIQIFIYVFITRHEIILQPTETKKILATVLCAGLMGACLLLGNYMIVMPILVKMFVLVAIGIASYTFFVFITGVFSIKEIKNYLKK